MRSLFAKLSHNLYEICLRSCRSQFSERYKQFRNAAWIGSFIHSLYLLLSTRQPCDQSIRSANGERAPHAKTKIYEHGSPLSICLQQSIEEANKNNK